MSDVVKKLDEARGYVEQAIDLLETIEGDEGGDIVGIKKVLDGIADLMDVTATLIGEEIPDDGEPEEGNETAEGTKAE